MFDENYIEVLTGLRARARSELTNYYAKLNETGKVAAHCSQVEIHRLWRNQNKIERDKFAENNYSALLVALKAMRKLEKSASVHTDEQLKFRIDRLKKVPKPKAAKMKEYIEKYLLTEILRLRAMKQSWRQISTYLMKYHNRSVTHTYIKQIVEAHEKSLDTTTAIQQIETPTEVDNF